MSRIQAPQILSDVYRDLRDRRLLIPAAVLVVALIAIPVMLSGGGAEVAPAPAPAGAIAADDATQVQSAVLVEQTGIRNYRKRLEALKSNNPFKQQFAVPTASSVAIEAGSGGGDSGAGTGSAAVVSPEQAASIESSASSGATEPSGGGVGDAGVSDAIEPVPSEPERVTEIKRVERLITRRIDVSVGPLGQAKRENDVRELALLPSKQTPVVAFLGVSEDAKKATFLVSATVASTDGDGSCAGPDCQFLTLRRGDQQMFHAANGAIYRLRLLRVRDVEVKAGK